MCEGKVYALNVSEKENDESAYITQSFSCSIKQILSYDNICVGSSELHCFKKPDCIFECDDLNVSESDNFIFKHQDKRFYVTSISDQMNLNADGIASIQLTPSELPSAIGHVPDTTSDNSIGNSNSVQIAELNNPEIDMNQEQVLAGDELDNNDEVVVLPEFDGEWGSVTGGTSQITDERIVSKFGEDASSMDEGLNGMGAQVGTSCTLVKNEHNFPTLMLLIAFILIINRRGVVSKECN